MIVVFNFFSSPSLSCFFFFLTPPSSGKQIEMQLQPKKKGDNVKGSIEFSVRPTTPKDLEDMGADTASRLARALISYIAFSFANAIVKMKPKNARFEVEAEFTVFGMCFIFCATVVIPLGTKPDAFEVWW